MYFKPPRSLWCFGETLYYGIMIRRNEKQAGRNDAVHTTFLCAITWIIIITYQGMYVHITYLELAIFSITRTTWQYYHYYVLMYVRTHYVRRISMLVVWLLH